MIRSVVWLKFRVSSGIPPARQCGGQRADGNGGNQERDPADEVVDSMRRIGNALPAALRETSEGGLAVTESARKIADGWERRKTLRRKPGKAMKINRTRQHAIAEPVRTVPAAD